MSKKAAAPGPRRARRRNLCRPLGELLEPRRLLALTQWTDGLGGAWDDSGNWGAGVPLANDIAVFARPQSGTVGFQGQKAAVEHLLITSVKGEGKVAFDLDGGRLTVANNLEVGTRILADGPDGSGLFRTTGDLTIRDGTMSVEGRGLIGYDPDDGSPSLDLLNSSRTGPHGRVSVYDGGRLEVSGPLFLGSIVEYTYDTNYRAYATVFTDGLVYVGRNGLVTSDSVVVTGSDDGGIRIEGENARWINDGDLRLRNFLSWDPGGSSYIYVGPGGLLQTSSIVGGPVYIAGGRVVVKQIESTDTYLYPGGTLVIDGGMLSPAYPYSIVDGATLTLEHGARDVGNPTALWIGGQGRQAVVNVLSGSVVERPNVVASRQGQLTVHGTGSRLTSADAVSILGHLSVTSGARVDGVGLAVWRQGNVVVNGADSRIDAASYVNLEGHESYLSVADQARLESDYLRVVGGGTVELNGAESRIDVADYVTVGGLSANYPEDQNPSSLRVSSGVLMAGGDLTIVSGGQVALNNAVVDPAAFIVDGGTLDGSGQILSSVTVQNGGRVSPSEGVLRTGSIVLQPGTKYVARLNGLSAGSQYSQMDVTGAVNLNGADLLVSEGFASHPGDRFVILKNDGSEPIISTFNGLLEGAVVVREGVTYSISYRGGDGNDIELVSNGNLPVILTPTSFTSVNTPEFTWTSVSGAATYAFHVNNLDTGQQNVIDVLGLTETRFAATQPLPLGRYAAFVQAFDATGSPSLMSPVREFKILPPFMPNVLADTPDANLGDGQALDASGNVSLRAAIQEANALPGWDKIDLAAGTFTLTRAGSGEDAAVTGDLDITDDVIIQGAGVDVTVIDANGLDRALHLRFGAKLTLLDVTVTGGLVGSNQFGGGILNEGSLNLINSKLRNNTAYQGGGLATMSSSNSTSAVLTGSVIANNTATDRGGGIFSRGYSATRTSTLSLVDTTISANTSSLVDGGGGGVYVLDWSDVSIGNSRLANNAGRTGGALYSTRVTDGPSAITITNSELQDNTATISGGAIHSGAETTLTVQSSVLSRNRVTDSNGLGGAIDSYGGTAKDLAISDSRFLDNEAPAWGGAIHVEDFGALTIARSEFRRNHVNRTVGSTQGGAIYAKNGTLSVVDSTFAENTSDNVNGIGGAILLADADAAIAGRMFSANSAQRRGGAIFVSNPNRTTTFDVRNSTFSGNRAIGSDGGAIYLETSNISGSMINVTMTENHAIGSGGAIAQSGFTPTLQLQNSLIAANSSGGSNPDVHGLFTSLGHNLIGDVGTATGFGAVGDLLGGNGNPIIDPALGPLLDHGGPTFTHELLGDSPAINGGAFANAPPADQRGVARPSPESGRLIDIGAFQIPLGTNHAPVNHSPGHVLAFWNEPLVFDEENGRQITITDFDAGSRNVQLTLVAHNGTFSLQSAEKLSLSPDGNLTGLTTKTLTGSPFDINAALRDIEFVPTLDFTGTALLTLTTDDLGNSGSGGPRTDQDTITLQVKPMFRTSTTGDTTDVTPGNGQALDASGNVSLRAAIQEANALPGRDKIELPAGTFTLTRAGSGEDAAVTGDLDITDDVIIQGAGVEVTIIDANGLDRALHLRSGAKLTLLDVTVTGGLVGSNQFGGGILNEGTLNLINSKLRNNTAYQGGGLATMSPSGSASAVLTGTVISSNMATNRGGGIFSRGYSATRTSTISVVDSTISANTSSIVDGGGGGVYVLDWSDVSIGNSRLANNTGRTGGALYSTRVTDGPSAITITNSELQDNTATISGGAINSGAETTLSVQSSVLSRNRVTDSNGLGGAIYSYGGTAKDVAVTDSRFLDNEAPAWGGAIQVEGFRALTIARSEFRRNHVNRTVGSTQGGAIYAKNGTLSVVDSTFSENTSDNVNGIGGVLLLADVDAVITGSTFLGNSAQRRGGAVFVSNPNRTTTFDVRNSTFSGNRAIGSDGGAIYLETSNISGSMVHVTMTGNHANGSGGAITQSGFTPTLQLQNSLIAANSSGGSNPDVYGLFTSLGHNLIGNVGTATGFGAGGDLLGGNGNPIINPMLGPLQDNGGATFTHALLGGSPGIDTGASIDSLPTDQRGLARVQGAAPDIGAAESSVDLAATALRTDGELALFVDYEITGRDLSSLEVGFFTSLDLQHDTFDEPLKSVTLNAPADLSVGTHTKRFTIGGGTTEIPLPGVGSPELDTNYHILAVVDPGDAIGEVDDGDAARANNNAAALVGAYHEPGGAVFVHGSPASDEIAATVGSVRIEINGRNYTYQEADVSRVVLRSHAGNDVVREEAVSASIQMIGGRGDNELHWDSRATLLDLSTFVAGGLTGVAVIDLTGVAPNRLQLDYASVVRAYGITQQLRVLGDSNDRVYIGAHWTPAGLATVFGVEYSVLTQQEATLLISQQTPFTAFDVNDPPVLATIGSQSVDEAMLLQFTVTASDPNDVPANAVTLSVAGLPEGATFTPATGVFVWTPGQGQHGQYLVTFTATDDGTPNLSDLEAVTITVRGPTWQNPRHPCDVTGDGDIDPVDVLTLINDINSKGSRGLRALSPTTPNPPPFLDPSGDNRLAPLDVLTVINYINTYGSGPILGTRLHSGASGTQLAEGEPWFGLPYSLPADVHDVALMSAISGQPFKHQRTAIRLTGKFRATATQQSMQGGDRQHGNAWDQALHRPWQDAYQGFRVLAGRKETDFASRWDEMEDVLKLIALDVTAPGP